MRDLIGSAPEWNERASCVQVDPEVFFPEKGGSAHEAKKVCRRCEVKAECLEYALRRDERFGIWGGMSEAERSKLSGKPSRRAAPDGGNARRKTAKQPAERSH